MGIRYTTPEEGTLTAEVVRLRKKVDELEQRISTIEVKNMPFGPIPRIPRDPSICFFCGEDHKGLGCPKLHSYSTSVERGLS